MCRLPPVLFLAVLLSGCASDPLFHHEIPSQLLGGTSSWEIKKVWDKNAIAGAPITVTFDGVDKISGFSGCNQYTAVYRVEGRRLRISDIAATTDRACSAEVMAQEKRLFDVLSKVHWARPADDGAVMLRMLRGEGDPVQLARIHA